MLINRNDRNIHIALYLRVSILCDQINQKNIANHPRYNKCVNSRVGPIKVVSEQAELIGDMERGRWGHGRGARSLVEERLREEIQILATRLEAVEAERRRDPVIGDESEEELEVEQMDQNERVQK